MSNKPISNEEISTVIFDHGLKIEKLQMEINNLKKLVVLAIATNLPQILKILTG